MSIILIEDDPKSAAQIKESLHEYPLEICPGIESATEAINRLKPALIIIDHDLKTVDGLQAFRQIHLLAPASRIIMLSSANDIPLAVAATKLGVADFFRKPVNGRDLAAAIKKNLTAVGGAAPVAEAFWLQGQSPALNKMYAEINTARGTLQNILLLGERGIDKAPVVQFIQAGGLKPNRKLRMINLLDFRRENLESAFWAAAQEAIGESSLASIHNEEDRCGTLYLDNIELLDRNFRFSVVEYFKQRRAKTDKSVLTVIGVNDIGALSGMQIGDYAEVEIPALRERKEDLAWLVSRYLDDFAAQYDKPVKGLSAELLQLFGLYDFPGNYVELAGLIEAGVLACPTETLGLEHLPVVLGTLLSVAEKKNKLGAINDLEEARKKFEKLLYRTLTVKAGGDAGAVARFLDVPRTVFADRSAELGQNPLD